MFYITDSRGEVSPYVPGQSRYGMRPGGARDQPSARSPDEPPSSVDEAPVTPREAPSAKRPSDSQSHRVSEAPATVRDATEPNLGSASDVPPTLRNSSVPPPPIARRSRQLLLLARQIMSQPVITLQLTDTLQSAEDLFYRRRVRHVPVVSLLGTVIGLLTDRDMLRLQSGAPLAPDTRVGDVMTTLVITARPDATIRQVAQVMTQARIGSIPIVDKHGAPLGIVTRSNILDAVVSQAPADFWR